jgi:L-malate glycosyltransferase
MISFLFVDSERVWRGGQDQLLTLLPGLIDRGHEVHLVCHPSTLLEERARSIGARVHPMVFRKGPGLISLVRIFSILREVRPDIIAFNTPRPILPGTLASKLIGVKARIIFRRVNFPLRRNPITKIKYNWGIDRIIAISESIARQLESGGVPPARIRIIYEGIDLGQIEPRRAQIKHPEGEPFVIGTVAHLSAEKGLNHLIEAGARIADVGRRARFVIVGDGKCRADLEAQVRSLGMGQSFQFTGFQENPGEIMKRFDIFVLPSLSEGLSSSILTAMARALPVVATSVGGIPELVANGKNGILVPPGNPQALATAIESLIDDPDKSFKMGQNGRQRMELRFTLERKILETESLCAGLLAGHGPIQKGKP